MSMKTITQREFRNNSAAVMDGVEAGETYHITRNGTEVAELRPLARRRRLRRGTGGPAPQTAASGPCAHAHRGRRVLRHARPGW